MFVGAVVCLLAALNTNAVVKFDNSFDKADWRSEPAKLNHLCFKYSPHKTNQADGSELCYKTPLATYKSEDGNEVTTYYAVINYPDDGTFYGFSKAMADGTMVPMWGQFYDTEGNLQIIMGYTPNQWKKMTVKKPSLKTEDKVFIPATPYSPDYTIKTTMQFLPTGVVTFTASTKYTAYAPQEIAGEHTTRKRVGGRMRTKSTTQLTGGWYFDVSGKATVNGRWKIVGDSLKITFTKPVTTATATYNEKALINKWKGEAARKFVPFELDTYRRQYMAQARADYPNYKVGEEKDAVKEVLKYVLDEQGFTSGKPLTMRLYGMNKDEIMAERDGMPVVFSAKHDGRYFSKGELVATLNGMTDDKKNNITADELEMRRRYISSELLSIDCPVMSKRIEDGIIINYEHKSNSAVYFVAARNENDSIKLYGTRIFFNPDRVTFDKAKVGAVLKPMRDIEILTDRFNKNEALLNALANDKKADKKARKQAKKYLSKTKNRKMPASVYYDYKSYVDIVNAWNELITIQKEYLPAE